MNPPRNQHRAILRQIAHQAMLEKGLAPDFSKEALSELGRISGAASDGGLRDLRGLPWCSIDNDDSRDLDQLTVAQSAQGAAATKILVAVADVDAVVRNGSAIDAHAQQNTTSVYTAGQVFPMLPERLSTDLTSLNLDADRIAMVVEMEVDADGTVQSSDIYRATVRNQAKLAYGSTGAWIERKGPMPQPVGGVAGLAENISVQDRVAQSLKAGRKAHGALEFETIKPEAVFTGDLVTDLVVEGRNRANDIIAEFMIAANGVAIKRLAASGLPALRRVVRTPKRWDRIVELAAASGFTLPAEPDPKPLDDFLTSAKASNPTGFPDLSLCVIKLLGPGEYVAQRPGAPGEGHFGLAVGDYAHSTAPNRRYPDIITQRLLKAALANAATPYAMPQLDELARHCTDAEDTAKKVERQVAKSAAAMFLESRIGQQFDGIVTGASAKGTWVRVFHPPVEGRLESGFGGVDVGDKIRVQLIHTDVDRGFIDFKRVRNH